MKSIGQHGLNRLWKAMLVLGFAVALATPVTAETPAGEFGGLVEVSEVLLDVLVTDRSGKVVMGLGQDDFIVEDAGKAVPLTAVSFYSNRFQVRDNDPAKVQHPAPNEVPADRYFILFFHDQKQNSVEVSALLRQQLEASRQSERWVREEMLPGDWVAVASYDYKLKVQQDFTQNRELLIRAIQRAARGKDPENSWESRRPEVPEGQPTLLKHLPAGKEMRDQTTRIYDGLRLLAGATREILGRKNLLLFSLGFGEFRHGISFFAEPDPRFYPALEQAFNDNNVAVYPIDLAPSELEHANSHFLTQLAVDTGGHYYENFTSFVTPLRQIADESNGYYLLSYQAEHPAGESGYRKVAVKTRNPEFQVRTRRGYLYGST